MARRTWRSHALRDMGAFGAPSSPGGRHASLRPPVSYCFVEINKLILNYKRKCKGLDEPKPSLKGQTKLEAHTTPFQTNAGATVSPDGRAWVWRETTDPWHRTGRPEEGHTHGQPIFKEVPKQVNEEEFFLQMVLEQIAT